MQQNKFSKNQKILYNRYRVLLFIIFKFLMSKKDHTYDIIFWALFIAMSLGGFMMIMLAAMVQ